MRYDDAVVGVITLSKLGLDQFDRHDLRLLSILADQAATALEWPATSPGASARRRAARSCWRSARARGEPRTRQVANVLARHLATVMAVEECAISWWDRANDRVASLGYYPPSPSRTDWSRTSTSRVPADQAGARRPGDGPGRRRPSRMPIPRRSALLLAAGNRAPRDAAARRVGRDDRSRRAASRSVRSRPTRSGSSLARTIANEASIALENARLLRRGPSPRRPRPADRLLQPPLAPRAVRPGGRSRPAHPPAAQPADAGPRRLQARQRHVRPPPRRRGPALDRGARSGGRSAASDVPARYGGDEFAILLPDADHEEAARDRRAARRGVRDSTFCHDGRLNVPIGVSIGVATFPADGRTAPS